MFHLTINQKHEELVHKYTYFSTIIHDQWDNAQEIKYCIGKATDMFKKTGNLSKFMN